MGKQEKKIIEKVETKPCGCVYTYYRGEEGMVSVRPCPPCGLMEAAKGLGAAATALGSVADTLRQQHNQAVMGEAMHEALKKMKKDG